MSGCPHCGKDAPAEGRFCTRCGTALGVDPVSVLAKPISTSGTVNRGSQWGLVGAALFAILAIIGYAAWSGVGSDSAVPVVDDPQTTLVPVGELGQGGPPFGRPVDLSLFVGGDERVLAIDLRTGDQTDLPVTGQPVAVSGGWLAAANDQLGLLSAAVDLDRSVVTYLDVLLTPVVPMVEAVEPGRAWLLSLSRGFDLAWVDLDLASGEVIESVPAPATAWSHPFGPSLTTSPSGGIFARGDDLYQRVHDGTLVAATQDRALVRTCTDPAQCELSWHATDNWDPLEVAVPTVPVSAPVTLSNNGRLLGFTSTDGHIHLLDTEGGEEYVLEEASQLTVAPNGAYAAAAVQGGVVLFSVDDRQEVRLDLAEPAKRGLLLAPVIGDASELGQS